MRRARCVPNTALFCACKVLTTAHARVMHPKCSPRRLPFAPQALATNAEQLAAQEEAVRDMLSTIFDQV